jgi:hypothetical protein
MLETIIASFYRVDQILYDQPKPERALFRVTPRNEQLSMLPR